MSFFSTIHKLFAGTTDSSPVFTPLEERILTAVQTHLPPAAGELFEQQVREINTARRDATGREVLCYVFRRGKEANSDALRFPARDKELRFATVEFALSRIGETQRVRLSTVDGYLFSLEFEKPIAGGWDSEAIDIRKVTIPFEVMEPYETPERASSDELEQPLTGDLGRWTKKYTLEEVQKPLLPEHRERLLKNIDAKLPDDFLAMTEQCEGFFVGESSICGLADVFEIPFGDDYFYILADRDAYYLGVRTWSTDGRVYSFYHDGDVIDPVSYRSFFDALDNTLLDPGFPRS